LLSHFYVLYCIIGVDVKEGSKFSKTDIFNGGVVYTSSTSGATTDSILIDVSDGMHHIPVHVRVRIVPVDDGFPTYGKPLHSLMLFGTLA